MLCVKLSFYHEVAKNLYHEEENMTYLVVGDAETQLEPLKELGFGEPILLDEAGNRVDMEPETSMK